MTNRKFQEQIEKSCSTQGWDAGNDTSAPTNQAMGGGASTVKEKCNAATHGKPVAQESHEREAVAA